MLQAWAQLVRLPNVFTAPVDVIAGAALSHFQPHQQNGLPDNIVWLCLISVCYYMAGMILNDVADVEEDRRERPFRPLPSGRISKTAAIIAGTLLMTVGLVIGMMQLPIGWTWQQSLPLFALPVLILLYNFVLKQTLLGPIVMGLCRGFNLLLGAMIVSDPGMITYLAAGVSTLYITGVTTIAFDETRALNKWRRNLGLFAISFAPVLLAYFCISSFLFKGKPEYMDHADYYAIAVCVMPAFVWTRALIQPLPANIGKAIKYSILGLIVLNSVLTFYTLGYPGLLVLLFLIPALFLGRYIYST